MPNQPLLKIIERLRKSDLLHKSGQYIKFPDWILSVRNSPTVVPKSKREKAMSFILGRGKINPADFDKMVENNNQDILSILLHRSDLSSEQLVKMASHPEEFKRGRTYERRGQAKELDSDIFQKMVSRDPDSVESLVRTGGPTVVSRLFFHGGNHVSGSDLFNIVTEREDLSNGVFSLVVRHPEFDASHMTELLKHKDSNRVVSGLRQLAAKDQLPDHIVSAALHHPNPDVRSGVFGSPKINVTNQQIADALSGDEPEVKTQAAGKIKTEELAKYVVDNLLDLPNASDIVNRLLNGGNLLSRYDRAGQSTRNEIFTPEIIDKIADYGIQKDPDIISGYGNYFWTKDVPTATLDKLLSIPDNPDKNSDDIKDKALSHSNITDAQIETALNNTSDSFVLSKISKHSLATPDQLSRSWQKTPKEEKERGYGWENSGTYSGWANNPNTPPETLQDMMSHDDVLSLSTKKAIAEHNNTPVDSLQHFMSNDDPDIRSWAANNPNASSDQVMHGILDKNKDVRAAWWDNPNIGPNHLALGLKDKSPKNRVNLMSHSGMTPELLKTVMSKDKSEAVRLAALKSENITPEIVQQAALNDKSDKVRSKALVHPHASPEIVESAIQNPSVGLAQIMKERSDLNSDQIAKLFHAVKIEADAHASKRPGKSANWSVEREYSSRKRELSDLMRHYLSQPNTPEELSNNAVANLPLGDIYTLIRDDEHMSAGSLNTALDRLLSSAPNDEHLASAIIKHPNAESAGILDRAISSGNPTLQGKIAESSDLGIERAKKLALLSSSDSVLSSLAHNSENTNHEVLESIRKNPAAISGKYAMISVASSPHANRGILEELWNNDNIGVRRAVMENSNTPVHIIKKGVNDSDESVKSTARKSLSRHEPDAYNDALGGHEIHVHPATEKLKHLKGLVQEAGGSIPKKDLQGIGFSGIPGQILDGKGNVTEHGIENFLKGLPHARYNVSYDKWGGAQRHDNTKDQKVLQLNMTNDHIKQLKDQGLYDTFKKVDESSRYSGHPVDHHSLGWARIDDSQPDHWHIDEIQSDFGQAAMRQLSRAKDEGHDPGQVDKLMGDLKKIIKIFSGPFKSINHAITAATHASARKDGIKGTSMDKPIDQAKQSGLSTERAFPGHFQQTYQQLPKDMKYETKSKDEVMPGHQSSETEVQYRKLVKSLEILRVLIDKVEKK